MSSEISDLIAKAAAAAKHAPDHLQEIAFSKAFDVLTANDGPAPVGGANRNRRGSTKSTSAKSGNVAARSSLESLNRTAHPEVNHEQNVIVNALYVLRAARDDLGIDGLTATEIADVLTTKFRCSTSVRGVGKALDRAGRYVNRSKEGRRVLFQLMAPGETYLNSLTTTADAEASADGAKGRRAGGRRTRKSKTSVKKTSSGQKSVKNSKTKKGTTKKKTRKRIGGHAAVTQLYESGFFSIPRTIGAIIEELKHQHARSFKANELSPGLLSHLRNNNLKRAKNTDNQYEYTER